jgi:hypothetical protein
MSRPTINSVSIPLPVNTAALNMGSQINFNGMNNVNPLPPNNFSNYPQPGNFQNFNRDNRPF